MTREEAIKTIESNRPTSGYTMLCEALDMAVAALQNQPVWISVAERLPQNYVSVLVYLPGESPFPTVHEAYIGEDGEWHSAVVYGVEDADVTHWMPLPKPPKEDA